MAENWWPDDLTEVETLGELEHIRSTGAPKWHPTEDRAEVVFEHGLVDRDLERDPAWWLTVEGNKRLGASHRKRGRAPGPGRAGRRRAKNKSAQSRAHSPVSRRALTQAEIRRRDVLSIVRRRDGYAHQATFEARVRREPGFAAAYRRGLITRGLEITEAGAEAWALLAARQAAILRDAPPERKKGKRCAAELERKVRRELSKIDS